MFSAKGWAFVVIFILFLVQNFLDYLMGPLIGLSFLGVIYYSLKGGPRFGLCLGFFAGCLAELFGQNTLGFYVFQFAAVGALSGFISFQIFHDSLPAKILWPVFAAYFSALAEVIFRQMAAGQTAAWQSLGWAVEPANLAATLFLSPVLFLCLQKFSGKAAWHA